MGRDATRTTRGLEKAPNGVTGESKSGGPRAHRVMVCGDCGGSVRNGLHCALRRRAQKATPNAVKALGNDRGMQLYRYCASTTVRVDHSTSGPCAARQDRIHRSAGQDSPFNVGIPYGQVRLPAADTINT